MFRNLCLLWVLATVVTNSCILFSKTWRHLFGRFELVYRMSWVKIQKGCESYHFFLIQENFSAGFVHDEDDDDDEDYRVNGVSGGEHDDNDENGDEAYVDEEEERKQIMIHVIQKLDPQSTDKSVRKSESFDEYNIQYTTYSHLS